MGSLARGERVVSTETECSRVQEEDRVPSVSPIIQTEVVPWDTYVFLDSLSVTGAVIYSRIQKCLPLGLSIRVSNNIAAIRPHADIYIIRLVGEIRLAGEIFVIERKRLCDFEERNSIYANFVRLFWWDIVSTIFLITFGKISWIEIIKFESIALVDFFSLKYIFSIDLLSSSKFLVFSMIDTIDVKRFFFFGFSIGLINDTLIKIIDAIWFVKSNLDREIST